MEDHRTPKHTWEAKEAKAQLDLLLEAALHHGPQVITANGKPTAVVISAEEQKNFCRTRSPQSLFFKKSPLAGWGCDLSRGKDSPEDLKLQTVLP